MKILKDSPKNHKRASIGNLLLLRDQDVAFTNMIGGCDKTFVLHLLNQPRRFILSYSKLALDITGRTFAIFQYDCNGLIIKGIFTV